MTQRHHPKELPICDYDILVDGLLPRRGCYHNSRKPVKREQVVCFPVGWNLSRTKHSFGGGYSPVAGGPGTPRLTRSPVAGGLSLIPYFSVPCSYGMPIRYSCPLCGRMVNRRGAPFRDGSQVESHIDGSHDAAHRDERGEDHREKIEENAEEVEEEDVPDVSESGGGGVSEDLRERVDVLEERTEVPMGLDTLEELADAHQSRDEAIEERVDELEGRVDRQEAVLYDLVDTVEVLGSAADWNDVQAASERVADQGSDAYPFEWEGETLDFKAERYE